MILHQNFKTVTFQICFERMPPKKAAGKPAKKKEGNPEGGVELDAEMKAKLFMLTCQSLQVQLGKSFSKQYWRSHFSFFL